MARQVTLSKVGNTTVVVTQEETTNAGKATRHYNKNANLIFEEQNQTVRVYSGIDEHFDMIFQMSEVTNAHGASTFDEFKTYIATEGYFQNEVSEA